MTATRLPDHSDGSGSPAAPGSADAFGAGAVRVWRRLAGAGVVALLALAFGLLSTGDDGTDRDGAWWALVVVVTTYVGAVLSWWITGTARGAVLVARHAAAGAVLGVVLAAVLTGWFSEGVGIFVVFALIGVPAGALVAAVAAGAGLVVPRRVAPVVAAAGAVAVAGSAFVTFRPEPPYDLFAVDATPGVAAAGGAAGLAQRTAETVEQAGGGGDLTAAVVWEELGRVSEDLGQAGQHLRFTPVEDLPVAKATGQRTRLITVRVRGQEAACVVVDPAVARVVDGACEDLDLVR
ncbi:hypothetical protein [Kineococcus sp. SYSU DK001]|uniref:hypothetical protein n=1 Tax=Kineococcus sp. SYSU DK001 TaxID=3383122 RepID=UPI003D7E9738